MPSETATFGAGCFWGVEHLFRKVPGVIDAVSGYSGGIVENPSYRQVCSDTTGHAEVVEVTFDPDLVSFEQLLEVFWAMHDPTQVNRQGPDHGSQYRSIVLTHSNDQQAAAAASRDRAQARYSRSIATEIRPHVAFYPAEDYHQRYYLNNGHEPYCHAIPPGLLEDLGLVHA
ncbi:MAG: peptide-methionine (S)-S-oxide reductase MsrA [Actinomycetota bacterium]|nr:peptide-methionine (S)-S-oxide reductase MsrA [Actinomycetota bacterium]